MYEDRRETFSIKDIVLQLLFIVLLVFILIWLFPTKGYLEKKLDGIEAGIDEKLKPLYTRLFTDNILTMKDAAKSYYTTPRLPQEVGDKVTMTLGEMYEKGLLLELVDSNNNSCDATKSYIELTKTEEEYELKVTLSCSDKEAYIIEHLGCYDYCNGRLCTKEEAKAEETKVNTVTKKYRYQYVLYTGEKCSNYGDWGEWTANKIDENKYTKVQTKTEKVLDHYKQEYKVIDTKYKDVEYYDDVYYGYSTKTVKKAVNYNYTTKTTTTVLSFDYKTFDTTTYYDYIYETNTTGTVSTGSGTWVAAGTTTSTHPLAKTSDGYRYTETGRETSLDCSKNPCETVTTYKYNVEKFVPDGGGTPVTTTTKHCPEGTHENAAKTGCEATTTRNEKYCPVGTPSDAGCVVTNTEKYCATGDENAAKTGCEIVTYEKQNYCALKGNDTGSGCVLKVKKTKKVAELVYGYVDGEAVYKNVTYYRSSTRTCSSVTTDYKWSESSNDTSLKSQGYTLTGVTEEI